MPCKTFYTLLYFNGTYVIMKLLSCFDNVLICYYKEVLHSCQQPLEIFPGVAMKPLSSSEMKANMYSNSTGRSTNK